METIILVIHLIIALAIIGLVLIQRSAGGGLGIGGGGGMGDFASARGTANALTRMTTYLAFAFFCTSLMLAWLATNQSETGLLDAIEAEQTAPMMDIAPPSELQSEEPETQESPVEAPAVPTAE